MKHFIGGILLLLSSSAFAADPAETQGATDNVGVKTEQSAEQNGEKNGGENTENNASAPEKPNMADFCRDPKHTC